MRVLAVATLVGLAAVAPELMAQQSDSAAPRPPRSSSTLITEDDIERAGSSVASAYDVVQLLRPRWLKQRHAVLNLPGVTPGDTGWPEFSVFVNDYEMGGLSYLRSVPAEQVYTMRFLSMNEVGARYGPTNGPGIVLTLRH
jgi:hypothetical protein